MCLTGSPKGSCRSEPILGVGSRARIVTETAAIVGGSAIRASPR